MMLTEKQITINQQVSSKEKLWTSSFTLLWQGQLVSALGNRLYSVV